MTEYLADFVLALKDAQEAAGQLRDGLSAEAARSQGEELNRIEGELGALRQEMATVEVLPMNRAGEIVEQLRGMLVRASDDELMVLHPHLVQAIAATMRGAE
jgi:hypothetical protein